MLDHMYAVSKPDIIGPNGILELLSNKRNEHSASSELDSAAFAAGACAGVRRGGARRAATAAATDAGANPGMSCSVAHPYTE